MNTIKSKSETGFRIESGWLQCDKFKLINSDLFKELKIGDKIDNIKKNDKNYVIEFTVITHTNDSEGSKKQIPLKTNKPNSESSLTPSDLSPTDRQREILKGQCLNIAFKEADITEDKFRKQAIINAKILFKDIEEQNYYNW